MAHRIAFSGMTGTGQPSLCSSSGIGGTWGHLSQSTSSSLSVFFLRLAFVKIVVKKEPLHKQLNTRKWAAHHFLFTKGFILGGWDLLLFFIRFVQIVCHKLFPFISYFPLLCVLQRLVIPYLLAPCCLGITLRKKEAAKPDDTLD